MIRKTLKFKTTTTITRKRRLPNYHRERTSLNNRLIIRLHNKETPVSFGVISVLKKSRRLYLANGEGQVPLVGTESLQENPPHFIGGTLEISSESQKKL